MTTNNRQKILSRYTAREMSIIRAAAMYTRLAPNEFQKTAAIDSALQILDKVKERHDELQKEGRQDGISDSDGQA